MLEGRKTGVGVIPISLDNKPYLSLSYEWFRRRRRVDLSFGLPGHPAQGLMHVKVLTREYAGESEMIANNRGVVFYKVVSLQ